MAFQPNALDPQGFVTRDPGAYTSTLIGTAATPGTVSQFPCFFYGIMFPNRVASGSVIIYDAVGTATGVVGTIVLGTQTFSDPPATYEFRRAMTTGLTIVPSANLGAIALWR